MLTTQQTLVKSALSHQQAFLFDQDYDSGFAAELFYNHLLEMYCMITEAAAC